MFACTFDMCIKLLLTYLLLTYMTYRSSKWVHRCDLCTRRRDQKRQKETWQ